MVSLRAYLLASVALLAAGLAAAYLEARSYFTSGVLQSERFDALDAGGTFVALSTASKSHVLDNCVDGIVAVYALTRPAERRNAVARECVRIADSIVDRSPTFSYAWFVGALAAARIRDLEGVIQRLRQSQITGPTEQWLAEWRVVVAESLPVASLPADVAAMHDRDLSLLVASERGIARIAERYFQDSSFRERITNIVETMPQVDQQRFIDDVRRAANRLGS